MYVKSSPTIQHKNMGQISVTCICIQYIRLAPGDPENPGYALIAFRHQCMCLIVSLSLIPATGIAPP